MKRILVFLGAAAALSFSPAFAQPHDHGAHGGGHGGAVSFATPDKAEFKEVIPGVTKSVLWEDPEKGVYGAYTRLTAGYDAGLHTHTNDVWIIVIKGAYMYKDESGAKRVGPGEFIRIPGGHVHQSGADPKEGALFYEESSGAFDLIPAK